MYDVALPPNVILFSQTFVFFYASPPARASAGGHGG